MKPHYQRIRKVPTHSGSTAIQVGYYKGKRFQLTKHIGSSKDAEKVSELVHIAKEYIRSHSPQREIDFNPQSEEILFKRGVTVTNSCLSEAYAYLEGVYNRLGFSKLGNDLLKHFAMMRILEPASKIRSIMLLEKYFNIPYKKTTVFRELERLVSLKEEVQRIAMAYAKTHLDFDFSLVFYDVTTLYFETHKEDDLRRNGYSKDNKVGQPQILVGLVVNDIGFPIYYDIFKGNTFEGKTILPVIIDMVQRYHIEKFSVVADAGMLSEDNLTEIEQRGIKYIVGARVGHLRFEEVQSIAGILNKTDKKIIRQGGVLYEYSLNRAKKDKVDNDQQVEKARYCLKHPATVFRRSKFLTTDGRKQFRLNEALIDKHRLLEGIKGYKTNITDVPDKLLIERYKDLWKIEQSFRIAKSDLEARPIYHRKETSIKYHILIVFVALCMARVIEVEKAESVKNVMDNLKDKWTITLTDEISGNSLKVLLDKKPH